MHTIDSPFQTHILGRDHWSGVEWSGVHMDCRGDRKVLKFRTKKMMNEPSEFECIEC